MCNETEKKQCCKDKCGNCFSLEGNTGDNYLNDGEYQEIKLIQSIGDEDSSVGLLLYSLDRSNKHELLSRFLNKRVKMSISILE